MCDRRIGTLLKNVNILLCTALTRNLTERLTVDRLMYNENILKLATGHIRLESLPTDDPPSLSTYNVMSRTPIAASFEHVAELWATRQRNTTTSTDDSPDVAQTISSSYSKAAGQRDTVRVEFERAGARPSRKHKLHHVLLVETRSVIVD